MRTDSKTSNIIIKNNNKESLSFPSFYFQFGPTYKMTYDAKRKMK